VENGLRFMIDALCREAGIVIAFPQRDVQVDSVRPLEVRVVPDPNVDGQPSPSTAAMASL
jgi:small-conductance mechanosensitive channel